MAHVISSPSKVIDTCRYRYRYRYKYRFIVTAVDLCGTRGRGRGSGIGQKDQLDPSVAPELVRMSQNGAKEVGLHINALAGHWMRASPTEGCSFRRGGALYLRQFLGRDDS